MKVLLYIAILCIGLGGCASGPRSVDKPTSTNVIGQSGDSDEYELTIIDQGFQRWFTTFGKPINYHTKEYYEQRNRQYVSQWNRLADQPSRSLYYPFENRIDYRPNIDYGIKLNHELYWYFRYIESLYGQQYSFGFGRRNMMY